jgi:hypothetical protein
MNRCLPPIDRGSSAVKHARSPIDRTSSADEARLIADRPHVIDGEAPSTRRGWNSDLRALNSASSAVDLSFRIGHPRRKPAESPPHSLHRDRAREGCAPLAQDYVSLAAVSALPCGLEQEQRAIGERSEPFAEG